MIFLKKIFVIIFIATFLCSCKSVLTKAVGLKGMEKFSQQEMTNLYHEYSADTPVYELDTNYINYSKTFHDTTTIKYLTQPMQLIFFNHGQITCHLVNCIVGGFPNLKWNRYGTFDSLPNVTRPILANGLLLDSVLSYIHPTPPVNESDNVCFVFWCNFMGRQSKNLIQYSKNKSVRENYKVIYVNNDNFYYYWGVERE